MKKIAELKRKEGIPNEIVRKWFRKYKDVLISSVYHWEGHKKIVTELEAFESDEL